MSRQVVWSYGGGTQSAAIGVLILQDRLPRPDIICFADTGREVTETWQYLETIVRPAFAAAGMEIHVVGHEYSNYDLYKSSSVLLPAFTTQSGSKGKLPTFCSNEWKQRPIRAAIPLLDAVAVTDAQPSLFDGCDSGFCFT